MGGCLGVSRSALTISTPKRQMLGTEERLSLRERAMWAAEMRGSSWAYSALGSCDCGREDHPHRLGQ